MRARAFLDANVLFSAAWRSGSRLHRLWELAGVELVTSAYAFAEASRNLPDDARRRRLDALLQGLRVVTEAPANPTLPRHVALPDKDRPILTAAIRCGATHLLTGDVRDFGPLMNQRTEGAFLLRPATFLREMGE